MHRIEGCFVAMSQAGEVWDGEQWSARYGEGVQFVLGPLAQRYWSLDGAWTGKRREAIRFRGRPP